MFGLDTGAPISIFNSDLLKLSGAQSALSAKKERDVAIPEFLGDTLVRTSIRLRGSNGPFVFVGAHIEKSTTSIGILTGILGNDYLLADSWRLDFSEMKFRLGSTALEPALDFVKVRVMRLTPERDRRRFFSDECQSNIKCPKFMFDTGIARYDFVTFYNKLPNQTAPRINLGTPLGTAICTEEIKESHSIATAIASKEIGVAQCAFLVSPENIPEYQAMGIKSLIEKKAVIEFDAESRTLTFYVPRAGPSNVRGTQ